MNFLLFQRNKTGEYKFSLIELLIVIAIIAILVSLLLPALNSAKNKFSNVSCLNNTRQLGLGTISFADDHKGFPPGANQAMWQYDLNLKRLQPNDVYYGDYVSRLYKGKYIGSPKAFICSKGENEFSGYWGNGSKASVFYFYCISSYTAGNQKTTDEEPQTYNGYEKMLPLHKAKNQSAAWLISCMIQSGAYQGNSYIWGSWEYRHQPVDRNFHDGARRFNATYFDGHAEGRQSSLSYNNGGYPGFVFTMKLPK